MRKFTRFLIIISSFVMMNAFAQIVVNVSGASQAALKIAILPAANDNNSKMDFIISGDLFKTGLFQPISPDQIQNKPSVPTEIEYSEFEKLGIQYVLISRILENGSTTKGQFVLAQIANKQIVFNETISASNIRELAHKVSDLIVLKLTGNKGSFATQIAYVLEKHSGNIRQYSLVVSDYDGANKRDLYTTNQPILSPTWSPDGSYIAFMTYANHKAQIMIQPVSGGRATVVASADGTTSAPSWSADGKQIAISKSDNNGNMDIYLINLSDGAQQKLTSNGGIDTEPTFSPDNRYIYFTSDRSGSPQIYRMDRNGSNVVRALVGGNYSTNSEVSPDGKSLALTRKNGGGYQIGLYDLQSGQFTALTNGRLDEGATFAPNGLLLMYTSPENSRSVIKMVNLKGKVVQTLSEPNGWLRDPSWGPSLSR